MKQNIIYLRTSTEEQNPENQLKDCLSFADKLNIKDVEIIQEQESAFKDDSRREKFNLIQEEINGRRIKNIIVWDLDRIYRNRLKLVGFFEFCKMKGCKIYSFRQSWLEDLNKSPAPFDDIMFNMMLQIMGWIAEEESQKKSERVKNAVRRYQNKPTLSYKGNKWGRKNVTQQAKNKIIELYNQGCSMKEIHNQVTWNNGKKVSVGSVHKILAEFKQEQSNKKSVQEPVNL